MEAYNSVTEKVLVDAAITILAKAMLHGHTAAIENGSYRAEELNAYIVENLHLIEQVQHRCAAILAEE